MRFNFMTKGVLRAPDDETITVGGDDSDVGGIVIEDDESTIVDLSPNEDKPSPALEARLAAAEEENRRLRSTYTPPVQQSPQAPPQYSVPQADPFKDQEEAVTREERSLGIEYESHRAAKTLTQEMIDKYSAQAAELQQKRINIGVQRQLQTVVPQYIQQQNVQNMRAKYADVEANQQAFLFAQGQHSLMRSRGEPDTEATLDKAMNAARVQFRMPGAIQQQASDSERNKFMGTKGGGPNPITDNKVIMGKAEKIMALSLYGDAFEGDEMKAYKQWAKGPGLRAKKLIAKGGLAK